MKVKISEEVLAMLFNIKSRFLREIPHPKLIRKAIGELGFDADAVAHGKDLAIDYETKTLLETAVLYDDDCLATKLLISNAQSKKDLALALAALLDIHTALIKKLAQYATNIEKDLAEQIKVSAPFDAYQIYKFIEQRGLQESEIKQYICAQVNLLRLSDLDVLSLSCLRAKKIIDNG